MYSFNKAEVHKVSDENKQFLFHCNAFNSTTRTQSAIIASCIGFPQDAVSIAATFLLQLEDLCDFLKITFSGYRPPAEKTVEKCIDCSKKRFL